MARHTIRVPVVTVEEKTIGVAGLGFDDFRKFTALLSKVGQFSSYENGLTIEVNRSEGSDYFTARLISEGDEPVNDSTKFSVPEGCGVGEWLEILESALGAFFGFAGWKRVMFYPKGIHGFDCRYLRIR